MTTVNHISVTVQYDPVLTKITGTRTENVMVSENLSFIDFLYFLFSSYPDIQKTYPPGRLGFAINGTPPKDNTGLCDGDVIQFVAVVS